MHHYKKLFLNNFFSTMIDTHAHIYAEEFNSDREDMIRHAQEQNVHSIYMPNIDHASVDAMLEINHKHPNFCFPMMGLHPCSVDKNVQRELYEVENWLEKNKTLFKGIGETGIDHHWDKTFAAQQEDAFTIQLGFAKKYKLPIIIHSRDANDTTIELVKKNKTDELHGVFHCFSGTIAQAKEMIDLGFYLGIGGVITFKNAGLAEVLSEIDLKHLVLETDAPYLAPVPHRGKRNEPSYLSFVVKKLAEVKKVSEEEIIEVTTQNAKRLFQV